MSEWISVKDNPPPPGLRVLTLDRYGHIMDRVSKQDAPGPLYFYPDGRVPIKDITHWMPMPEPPKEEE